MLYTMASEVSRIKNALQATSSLVDTVLRQLTWTKIPENFLAFADIVE